MKIIVRYDRMGLLLIGALVWGFVSSATGLPALIGVPVGMLWAANWPIVEEKTRG